MKKYLTVGLQGTFIAIGIVLTMGLGLWGTFAASLVVLFIMLVVFGGRVR